MTQVEDKPRVGIGVLVLKGNKTLLGKRKGSHGSGEFSSPGGHLEYMESFEDCAKRETLEECGVSIKDVDFLFVGNLDIYKPRHYVHIGLVAQWESGEPEVLEPEKAESWDWYDLDDLPENIFGATALGIESYKSKSIYLDLK